MVNNDQEVAQNKGGLLFFFTTNFTFAFSFGNTSVLPNDFPVRRGIGDWERFPSKQTRPERDGMRNFLVRDAGIRIYFS